MLNRNALATKILNAIKQKDPALYSRLMVDIKPPAGMGAFSDFLDRTLKTINDIATTGVGVTKMYTDTKSGVDAQRLAQQQALYALRQEDRSIELARLMAKQTAATTDQLRAEAELQQSRNELQRMIADIELSGTQQKGLWLAGGLTVLLVAMVARRKGVI